MVELQRAAFVIVFLALVALLAAIARAYALRQRAAVIAADADPALATGAPTILYFHGDRCADCVIQERELDALLIAHPEVAIRADHAPSDLSARFRVLTVPTTVILDGGGRARAVNYGLTRRDVLEAQLRRLGRLAESA